MMTEHICLQCGKVFTSHKATSKYCSQGCSYQAMRDLNPMTVCPVCGKSVRQVLVHGNRRQVFDSKECAGVWRHEQALERRIKLPAEKKAERERLLIKTCIVCGKQFKAHTLDQLCCSDDCKRTRAKDTSRTLKASRYTPKAFKCENCGKTVTPQYGDWRADGAFCSDACMKQYTRHQGKQRRRARLKGAAAEVINDRDIFERDHWTCAICGQPVDREPSLFYNPLAASLDHIVALSRGGPHTRDNVRCAHFICNSLKRDADDIVAKERAKRWFNGQAGGRGIKTSKEMAFARPAGGDAHACAKVGAPGGINEP